jgi:hypothetical protein
MNEKLLYSVIVRLKQVVLCEFTDYTGNFSLITKLVSKKFNELEYKNNEIKLKFIVGNYKVYCLKFNYLYIITCLINSKKIDLNLDSNIFCYLFEIKKNLLSKIKIEDLKDKKAYSLSNYLDNLKKLTKKFNNNNKVFHNNLNKIKNIVDDENLNDKIFDEKSIYSLSTDEVHNSLDKLNISNLKESELEEMTKPALDDMLILTEENNQSIISKDEGNNEKNINNIHYNKKKIIFTIIFLIIIITIIFYIFYF